MRLGRPGWAKSSVAERSVVVHYAAMSRVYAAVSLRRPRSRVARESLRARVGLLVALAAGGALLGSCEETTRGFEQDTRALEKAAAEKVDRGSEALELEMDRFKQRSQRKLGQFEAALAHLESRAGQGVTESKAALQQQITRTREKLEGMQAASREQWDAARKDLSDGLTALGKDINQALRGLGNAVEKKLD